ncbi:hypothetical protein [Pseudoalteromonas spongiae]|uniref:Uncharacterized protein n=1 Tax=Pseudoalteromonas spongiae TaxID=298657 RepID=A0ABU8EP15_9GAMM
MQTGCKEQTELWRSSSKSNAYNALCNTFYVREIHRLSKASFNNVERLQRRFASLPYYIEKAASHILDGNSPLTLDTQNGSWIAKQSRNLPKYDLEKNTQFFGKNAFVGLIIPVLVYDAEYSTVRIDSVDEVTASGFHCNQFGWVDKAGKSHEGVGVQVLKPSKTAFSAACCGHVWLLGRATTPRVLTLREMLLAARINWQDFKHPFITQK